MKKFILILYVILLSSIILPARVFAVGIDEQEEVFAKELKLYLNEAKIISVNNPTRVAIANPKIADVREVSKTELTLTPKAEGTTTLIIWDSSGEESYRVMVFSEHLDELKRRIDMLLEKLNLPEVYTEIAEEERKVLLLGRVKTDKEKERITTAFGDLKDKLIDLVEVKEERAVVEIDVQVLELNKDATKTLGFLMPGQIVMSEPNYRISKTARGALDAMFHVFDWPRNTFTATIDMLEQEGKAKILSRPRIACQSGKEAELLVGGEKPILTTAVTTGGGEGTEVEYKEYGIKLNVKPEVTQDRKIKLALNLEVSDVGSSAETLGDSTSPSASAYPITKRSASTELFLEDGQTLIIGGLVKQKTEIDTRKVFGLGDLPIIGLFFRHKETKLGGGEGERGDTELFITLTPTIVSEDKPLRQVKKQDESLELDYLSDIDEGVSDPLTNYAYLIQNRILKNLTYPLTAKQAGFQGAVKLSLHLSYRGEVLDVVLRDSSGYQILDDNAVSLVKAQSPYPPFPSSLDSNELWIDIPINYQLD